MLEELDLIDLFKTFWKKKVWFIYALVIGIVVGIVYNIIIIVPKYSSWATLLTSKATYELIDEANSNPEFWASRSELTVNQRLISTYIEIIRSRRVIMQAAENLGIEIDYEKYWKWVSAYQVESTDIIRVTTKTDAPEKSKQLADEVVRIALEEIDKIYGGNDITIIDSPQISEKPEETEAVSNIITTTLVSLLITVAIIFVKYYFKGNNKDGKADIKSK